MALQHSSQRQNLTGAVLTKFEYFPRLPPEIRQMIWQFAMPSRVFEVDQLINLLTPSRPFTRCKHDIFAAALAPPAIRGVCREGRDIAEIHGNWRYLGAKHYGLDITGRRTWFDSSTDMLVVHWWTYWTNWTPVKAACFNLLDFCNDITTLCVDIRSLSWIPLPMPLWFACSFSKGHVWPKVKDLVVFRDVIELHVPKHFVRNSNMFTDGNRTVLVDLKDIEKLQLCKELLGKQSKSFVDRSIFYAHLLDQLIFSPHAVDDYKDLYLGVFYNKWLHGLWSALPDNAAILKDATIFMEDSTDPVSPRFNHTHPWARKHLDEMPHVDIVLLVRLCKAEKHNYPKAGSSCWKPGRGSEWIWEKRPDLPH